ncbi:MAG: repair protein SbcC/Rad50 [Pseudonocardiales bacterium]|nr:repair protein SbcC/Rad50 [Pseudonocardiales bacterium]
MRLHALELAAIGPFASVQRIDFDELQASGLFLLDGPTGAGKTTVLDAITFALYGPGENRGDGRLHSDFAAPGVEPFVVLEFSLRGVRYRIRRTPEYERPKLRGGGVTIAHASAHLERQEHGSWVSRSANKAEIAELLDDELGLTREQFHQVVLLPQGEFATFLRANDDERRGVLSRLFGTGLYQRLTDELESRRQVAARALTAAAERITTCIAVAAEAAGLDATERDALCALPRTQRDARLIELRASLAARRGAANTDATDAEQSAAAARAAFDRAAARTAIAQRFIALQSQRAGHHAVAPEVDEARAVLAAALRAEAVRPLVDAVRETGAAAQRARQAAEPHLSSDELKASLTIARDLARAGEVAAARQPAVRRRLDAARTAERLEPEVRAARTASSAAVAAHLAAGEEHLRRVELRLAGLAAAHAGALRAGEPCAVCGSAEHPAPATKAPDAADAAQVRAAHRRRDEAERQRVVAEQLRNNRERACETAATVAGPETVEVLAGELAALDAAIAAGTAAAAAEEHLVRAIGLAETVKVAASAHARAQAHAETEALAAGFESLDAAAAAVRASGVRTELDERISAWGTTAASLDAALSAAEFRDLSALPPHEVETYRADSVRESATARATLAAADAARSAAVSAADRAQRGADRFDERLGELAAADAALSSLEGEVTTVMHLAKLARGMAGQRRVALTTYVLRHWFEHVVDAANVRLSSISSGRYSLIRVDEGDTRSERAGLTLHVIDAHTGEARTPRSLSGGETFYTSLALALGLADVVKAEAGGVDLDTLFIDEGFGTLDADTLEQVMSVIDELRDRGRVVGIVSHVADLKDRIPERLEVRRLPDGSSALRVVA